MQADGDLWAFALRVYGQPGVPDACLGLQDGLAADVNLLLFAAWLGAGGRRLDSQETRAAVDAVIQWHGEVVEELRRLRRRLKTGPAPAPNLATDALREAVKACELSAEKIELEILQDLRDSFAPGLPDDPMTAAAANLVSVLGITARTRPGEAEAGRLSAIIEAAIPNTGRSAIEAAVLQHLRILRQAG